MPSGLLRLYQASAALFHMASMESNFFEQTLGSVVSSLTCSPCPGHILSGDKCEIFVIFEKTVVHWIFISIDYNRFC